MNQEIRLVAIGMNSVTITNAPGRQLQMQTAVYPARAEHPELVSVDVLIPQQPEASLAELQLAALDRAIVLLTSARAHFRPQQTKES